MPFPAAVVSNTIVATGASLGLVGTDLTKVAGAIAMTCSTQFLLPGTVQVMATGTAGVGAIGVSTPPTGVVPQAMSNAITLAAASKGLVGTGVARKCMAISTGIVSSLPLLVLTGISPGVGVGAGSGKATLFNAATFYAQLTSTMATYGALGQDRDRWSLAIAEGVCNTLNLSLVIPGFTIIGTPSAAPAATGFLSSFV